MLFRSTVNRLSHINTSSGDLLNKLEAVRLVCQETGCAPRYWKLALIKRLYERGYDRSAIMGLFTFVDWVMLLPEATKLEFWQELKVYEEERKMPYITSVEQIGYDRGVEAEAQRSRELILEAQRSIALNLLRQGLSIEMIAQATGLSIAQLQKLQSEIE